MRFIDDEKPIIMLRTYVSVLSARYVGNGALHNIAEATMHRTVCNLIV